MQRPPRSFLIITRPPGPGAPGSQQQQQQNGTNSQPGTSTPTSVRATIAEALVAALRPSIANQQNLQSASIQSPSARLVATSASRIRPNLPMLNIIRYPPGWVPPPNSSGFPPMRPAGWSQNNSSNSVRPVTSSGSTNTDRNVANFNSAVVASNSPSMVPRTYTTQCFAQQPTQSAAMERNVATVPSNSSIAGPSTTSTSGTPAASSSLPACLSGLSAAVQAQIKYLAQRRALKRAAPPICNGRVETWEEKSNEFLCPICLDVLHEAHITSCGHTYCRSCIIEAIDFKPNCPKCSSEISKNGLTPNILLMQLIAKQHGAAKQMKTELAESGKLSVLDMDVTKFLASKSNDLSLGDINLMITTLSRRKEILTAESKAHQRQLLLEFLSQLYRIKQAEKLGIDREVHRLETDIKTVREAVAEEKNIKVEPSTDSVPESEENASINVTPSGFNTGVPNNDNFSTSMAAKKARINMHFSELVDMYLDARRTILHDPYNNDSMVPSDMDVFYEDSETLSDFANTLTRVSRYSSFKPLATFSYSADLLSSSNIVSSIEFDKDNEFFAIAGVTRRIKIFEYVTVVGSNVDIHCPSSELACEAKISCVAWSGYFKNRIASSDYDGCVLLWDAATGDKMKTFSEHEKRVWSVDWSCGDPRLLASGSDDTKVKLWSTEQERSVATLESKANVCCVKFCPENTFHIAFGSADHCVHYYDLRNTSEPLGLLIGHKKAVSYVKFASRDELISASTDSNLKLWNLNALEEIRSYRGHINEKNFVGLATDGDYVACGSENNSLYVYYKKLQKPLFSYKFDNHQNMLQRPAADDSTEFVSAVAWKKGSPVMVAANSQGSIKVLEMQ